MAYHWFTAFNVLIILAVSPQVLTAQSSEHPSTFQTSRNSTRKERPTPSISVYSLNDFLKHFGVTNEKHSQHKRNIEYNKSPELQQRISKSNRCPCQTIGHQDQLGSVRRSPTCVRKFLVKQLQETNENINCLLECLARNSATCKCPLPPRINIDWNSEQGICGCNTQSEEVKAEDNDVNNESAYPRSCVNCMYKPELPTAKSNSKRMIVDEPLVYYRIHSTPNRDGQDWDRLSEIKQIMDDSAEKGYYDEEEELKTNYSKNKMQ